MRLTCKHCGRPIGIWGGLNGSKKQYYKHHTNRKVEPPHKPEPATTRQSGKGGMRDEWDKG